MSNFWYSLSISVTNSAGEKNSCYYGNCNFHEEINVGDMIYFDKNTIFKIDSIKKNPLYWVSSSPLVFASEIKKV